MNSFTSHHNLCIWANGTFFAFNIMFYQDISFVPTGNKGNSRVNNMH